MATNIPVILETSSDPTVGSVLYWNGKHYVPLAPGSSGKMLLSAGAATNPAWSALTVTESVVATASAVGALFANDDFGNVTSVSLTAGTWLCSALVHVQAGTFTVTGAAISIYSGTTNTDHVTGSNVATVTQTNTAHNIVIPMYQLALEATTTVYLKARLTGTEANVFSGRLTAVKIG